MSDTGASSFPTGPETKARSNAGRLARAGLGFWIAMALGAALRFYFAFFTLGTNDVNLWEWHAYRVHDVGVVGHYRDGPEVNHPPFIMMAESLGLQAANGLGIPYRIVLRLPFAIFDAGTTVLLLLLLRGYPARFLLGAIYWLSPLTMIFSAYHGNTDSAIAFFLILCCVFLRDEKIALAALALGLSAWTKLPGLLALPALLFFVNGWRRRLLFLVVAALTALVGFFPALLQDPQVVLGNVFGYRGQPIHTAGAIPIWGPRVLFFSVIGPANQWPEATHEPILFFLAHSWQIAIALTLIFVWLRRSRRSIWDLAATIAGVYVILYALIDTWAFQYFAWSLPFWFFLPKWFWIPSITLASGYIYGLYWFLCGNGWLLGQWDFMGHANWPFWLIALRNTTFLFFLGSACVLLVSAAWRRTAAPGLHSHSGETEPAR